MVWLTRAVCWIWKSPNLRKKIKLQKSCMQLNDCGRDESVNAISVLSKVNTILSQSSGVRGSILIVCATGGSK